ncbi:MAG: hypothetical protein WA885_23325 [Phormidesmis sp.]
MTNNFVLSRRSHPARFLTLLLSRGLCVAFCVALPHSFIGLVSGAGWAAYGLITGLVWLFLSGRHSNRQEAV